MNNENTITERLELIRPIINAYNEPTHRLEVKTEQAILDPCQMVIEISTPDYSFKGSFILALGACLRAQNIGFAVGVNHDRQPYILF